jgi:hypothetical protein
MLLDWFAHLLRHWHQGLIALLLWLLFCELLLLWNFNVFAWQFHLWRQEGLLIPGHLLWQSICLLIVHWLIENLGRHV